MRQAIAPSEPLGGRRAVVVESLPLPRDPGKLPTAPGLVPGCRCEGNTRRLLAPGFPPGTPGRAYFPLVSPQPRATDDHLPAPLVFSLKTFHKTVAQLEKLANDNRIKADQKAAQMDLLHQEVQQLDAEADQADLVAERIKMMVGGEQ